MIYIYSWATVCELQLDQNLPMEVPTGFKELRMEILSFGDGIADSDKIADEGRMGLYG